MVVATKRGALIAALAMLASAGGHNLYADVLKSPAENDPQAATEELTDSQIREVLVQDSIGRYTGSCACPYHQKWNERLFRFPNNFRDHPTIKCGNESEYVRPGGPTVFCYNSDVPLEMVEAYREHLRSTFLTEPRTQF